MKTLYQAPSSHFFTQRLNDLENELYTMIAIATDYIIQHISAGTIEIDLSEHDIRAGAFETLIDGYPKIEAITIADDTICLKMELLHDYHPIKELFSLSPMDKIELLKALETIIMNPKRNTGYETANTIE